MKRWFGLALVCLGTAAVAAPEGEEPRAEAIMTNPRGEWLGTVELRQMRTGTMVGVDLRGLPPGEHGFHVHETGRCEPPYKSAGEHLNTEQKKHGYDNPYGFHAGDFPNLWVTPSGRVAVAFFIPWLSLTDSTGLFDADGSAIIVHARPDDYATDPSGTAGDRIACGVLRPEIPPGR